MLIGNFTFCQIYGISWFTLDITSIFVMAVLNLCRTISIYQPFRVIQKKTVLIPVFIYITVALLDTTFPLWFGSFYKPDYDGVQCNYNMSKIMPYNSLQSKIYRTIHTSVNRVIIPMIIIICCVLSSIKIWNNRATKVQCSRRNSTGQRLRQRRRIEATKTVVLLGIIYILLNIHYNVIYVISLYHKLSGTRW